MKLCKLTDANDVTRAGHDNAFQWGTDVCCETSGEGDLCGPGWSHWYTDPLVAVLLNPIHGDYDLSTAHMWEGDDGGGKTLDDHGMKIGCTRGTTRRRVELPAVTTEQRVRFGILCALEVEDDSKFRGWAADWLSGRDRSEDTAHAAYAATWAAGAAYAAYAAAVAAEGEAAYAAEEAAGAAWAAAGAARGRIDLIALAEQAMNTEGEADGD